MRLIFSQSIKRHTRVNMPQILVKNDEYFLNSLFQGIHNDISFVLGFELNLYEHQSTVNPNIPLRNLFYVADLLQKITGDMNIYGHKKLVIPTPRFVVFYNGIEKLPERCVYRLSDLYGQQNANAGLDERQIYDRLVSKS